MATKNPSKFAEILITKLNQVIDSQTVLETSFTDAGVETFKRPKLPVISSKEARTLRVSEWVDTSQYVTQTGQLDDLKSRLIIEAESEDTSFTEETVIIYEIT